MKPQVAVIGLGVFGDSVARTLAEKGAEVLAIDASRDVVRRIADVVAYAAAADATDEEALVAAGVKDVDTAVVAVGDNLEGSILTTAIVRNLGVPNIIARALNHLHAQILREVGATEVVFPEQDIGVRVAHTILGRNLLEYFPLSPDYVIAEVAAGENFIGKALNEIRFRNEYGVTVVAMGLRAPGEEGKESKKFFVPEPDEVVREGSVLVLAGKRDRVEKLIHR